MLAKFKALSWLKKAGLILGCLILLGAISSDSQPKQTTLNVQNTNSRSVLSAETQDKPTTQNKEPVVTTGTTATTESIPYESTSVNSSSLPKGQTKITTYGVNGTKTLTYKITYTNGTETKRELISEAITIQPITQVTTVGTYVAPAPQPTQTASKCDPNYTGCVPNVYPSDVDCAGGSGNGPYYTNGPIQVVGSDHYGLDRNHDGYACE